MPYGPQGLGQGAYGQRDRIAQTLMDISQPPPQSIAPQIPQMPMPPMPQAPQAPQAPLGAPPPGGMPPQAAPIGGGMPPQMPMGGGPPRRPLRRVPGLRYLSRRCPACRRHNCRRKCDRRDLKCCIQSKTFLVSVLGALSQSCTTKERQPKVSKPDPPTPPNPYQTAAAQTGTNVSTGVANAFLNNVNQNTPEGSLR